MEPEVTDPDLTAAIASRDHWRPVDQNTAEYDPGHAAVVRVGRIANPPKTGPTRHDRYYGVVMRDGRAEYRDSFGFATGAVAWAERQRLS